MDLKIINNYIDIKLLLITISITIGFLYCYSDNNLVLKKKILNSNSNRMLNGEIIIKESMTVFIGIVIAIILSKECLFQPNIINI